MKNPITRRALASALMAATAMTPFPPFDVRGWNTIPSPKRNTFKRGQRKQKGKR